MNVPGFTAEASLYNVSARYRATAEASSYGGLVQPAGSPVFDPDRPIWCLRYVCAFWDPNEPWHCWGWVRIVGVRNPVTGHCD